MNRCHRCITFISSPFVKSPIRLGLVLGGTIFADVGYIWNGTHTIATLEPKRSVGLNCVAVFQELAMRVYSVLNLHSHWIRLSHHH